VETAAAASKNVPFDAEGLGVDTMLHALPFQCSASETDVKLLLVAYLTAHTSPVEMAVTPSSSDDPALGLLIREHSKESVS